jgi:hypothetical protein
MASPPPGVKPESQEDRVWNFAPGEVIEISDAIDPEPVTDDDECTTTLDPAFPRSDVRSLLIDDIKSHIIIR